MLPLKIFGVAVLQGLILPLTAQAEDILKHHQELRNIMENDGSAESAVSLPADAAAAHARADQAKAQDETAEKTAKAIEIRKRALRHNAGAGLAIVGGAVGAAHIVVGLGFLIDQSYILVGIGLAAGGLGLALLAGLVGLLLTHF